MKFEIKCNTYKQLLNGFLDRTFPKSHKLFFLANPFAGDDDPAQIEAISDGEILGSVYAFPLEIVHKSNRIFKVCAGSTLFVKPDCRGMGIGGRLTMQRLQLTKDKIAIASGLSNMSLPIFQKKGFSVFFLNRYIFLQDSRPVVEIFVNYSFLVKLGTRLTNLFLLAWRSFLNYQTNKYLKGFDVIEVSEATKDIEDIIRQDQSLFRENHTIEWFNWVLKGGFVDDTHSKQHLFIVKDANTNVTIAFFMTKERFHKQASHRGFKNVILGSVIEWGVRMDSRLSENHILLKALLSFGPHVDAIEICTANDCTEKYLRRKLLLRVGESNFAIKAADDSPIQCYPEYCNKENWRIRPAASDNSFD